MRRQSLAIYFSKRWESVSSAWEKTAFSETSDKLHLVKPKDFHFAIMFESDIPHRYENSKALGIRGIEACKCLSY